MTIIPIRNISKLGVITDMDAYDLPMNSLQMAVNVRLEDGTVSRGPIFRTVGDLTTDINNMVTMVDANNTMRLLVERTTGRMFEWVYPSTQTDVSPASWVDSVSTDASTTYTSLNGVIYSNRSDRSPWYRLESSFGNRFADLSTYSANALADLPSTTRFKALRSINGVLVGINILKDGIEYTKSVWWSNFSTEWGAPPPDWDYTSTTSSSGINTLAEMPGNLVDGCKLGNSMILYGDRETWAMDYVGGNSIFTFRRLFAGGVINANCVAEHEGRQYVFGDNDIYITDGLSKTSIASGRVRKYIYKTMVKSESKRFFVVHNRDLNEIMFCYVSTDPYLAFPYGQNTNVGCNRAAVYNYNSETWYFYDLPFVSAATFCSFTFNATFDDTANNTITIDSVGGSISTYGENKSPALIVASNAFIHPDTSSIAAKLRSFEQYDSTSTAFLIDTQTSMPAYVYKQKIDFDEIGTPLRGYKLLTAMYPQAELDVDDDPLTFTLGTSDTSSQQPVWGDPKTFAYTDYRVDHFAAGRYLSIKIMGGISAWSLSGYDIDITVLGDR